MVGKAYLNPIFFQRISCFSIERNVLYRIENEIENDTEPERVDKIAPPKIVEIIFDCTDCSRAFSSRTAFEEHECHTDTAKNQCDICNEK